MNNNLKMVRSQLLKCFFFVFFCVGIYIYLLSFLPSFFLLSAHGETGDAAVSNDPPSGSGRVPPETWTDQDGLAAAMDTDGKEVIMMSFLIPSVFFLAEFATLLTMTY